MTDVDSTWGTQLCEALVLTLACKSMARAGLFPEKSSDRDGGGAAAEVEAQDSGLWISRCKLQGMDSSEHRWVLCVKRAKGLSNQPL